MAKRITNQRLTEKGLSLIDYETLVVQFIRERYSLNQELAILRQRDEKVDEFNAYNLFVEECKTRAKRIKGII
jgi:hypothetical protein